MAEPTAGCDDTKRRPLRQRKPAIAELRSRGAVHAHPLGPDDRQVCDPYWLRQRARWEAGLVAWEVTIAAKLKELGYSNACFGKWHCGEHVGRLPTDDGFDYWYGPPVTWDVAQWPDDKFSKEEGLEP